MENGRLSIKGRTISLGRSTATKHTLLLLLMLLGLFSHATTKTATTTGNWSNPSIWSPSGVPKDTDNVIISGGKTVTVDSIFTCNNLDLGNVTSSSATLKIVAAGNSLIINGDFKMNPNDKGNTFTLDAGPGTINIAGTFSHWSNTGTNQFKISTGALNFTPSVIIDDSGKRIIFTGAGSVTFQGDFTDEYNKVTYYAGCTINFYGNYSVSVTNVDWRTLGTANFYGTGTITHAKNIIFNEVNILANASTTLSAGSGSVIIEGNLTLASSSLFTMSDDLEVDGSLTNNGGSISTGISTTLTMNGSSSAINGSTGVALSTLQIGSSSNGTDRSCTISRNCTVNDLIIYKSTKNRTLSLSGSSNTLTVTGDVTINQPTANSRTALLYIGNSTCHINGNLIFTGTNNGTTRVCKVQTTSGTFTLDGNITWMSNNAVATEVITTATGTLNFASSITMGTKSGTIAVTGAGDINFNGTSAPSLNFGGATSPVLTTSYGSNITFEKGLTASSILTFTQGSTQIFDGTATVTPTAAITFGHLQINSGYTLTTAGNLNIKGNWINNGTFVPGTYTVTFNGSATQQVSNSGGVETFYKLSATPYGTTVKLMNDVTVTNLLTMNGANIDMNSHTFTLGNGSGAALVYSMGQAYGGTWKRYWPASTAITSTSGNYYGLFPIGTAFYYRPITINSTSNPTIGGYVSATHTDLQSATIVNYTDNEGSVIEQIADMHSDLSTTGLTGGTYNLGVKFSNLGSAGNLANLKLVTYTGGVMGSHGTHATTTGSMGSPTGYRTGLSASDLSNTWVLGTNDRYTTPMYQYVYAIKSGNWNDVTTGNGTWSFTPGGVSCDCTPGGSGYAEISEGFTVTLTATDSVKFLDIDTSARLVINNGKTLNCTGNISMYSTGNFTNNGTLNVTGELLMSSSTSPTVNGNVNVAGWFTLPSGTAYTQSNGTLTVGGDIEIAGDLSMASGTTLSLTGNGAHISGSGTYTTAAGGSFPLSGNKIIDPGTALTIGTSSVNTNITLASNTTVNNVGNITLNGNMTGANASTSIWINNATSSLSITGTLLSTGTLDVSTSPNTVYYNGTGAQNIKTPLVSYYNLAATNAGTKSLTADIYVDNEVILGGNSILEEGTHVLSGDADLTMSGTSELKLQRSVEDIYPELSGTYNCSGGTVTIYQTADSAIVREGNYYNLKLNGTTPYDISAVSSIANNLDVTNTASLTSNSELTIGGTFTHSSTATSTLTDSIAVYGIVLSAGTLRDGTIDYFGGQSINVTGSGGWNKNGGNFIASTGTVYFSGSGNQSLTGTSASQTFNSINVNKSGGTVTIGGSTTTLNMVSDMILTGGTLDAGTATAINMTGGSWQNDGGTFTPGSSTVTFSDTTDQAIQGIASAQTFNHIIVNNNSNTLTIGGSTATLTLNGNMTLSSGSNFNNGTATNIVMTGGNWINNGGTFTPSAGTISFTGSGAQAIGGTVASQTLNGITVSKSGGTLRIGDSTTSLTVNQNINLNSGTFDKGTAAAIYVGGNWTNNGGDFIYGTGTVTFNGSGAQAINGSAVSQTFYNTTVDKSAGALSLSESTDTLHIEGNMTLTAGTFDGGTATTIYMNVGNWTNNGGTFQPRTSTVVFNSTTGAQAINGTATGENFGGLTVDKTSQSLITAGNIANLTVAGDMTLNSGTFDPATVATVYAGGNWTNNGGNFTYRTGTVDFNGNSDQDINGNATAQSFFNFAVDKSAGTLSFSGKTDTLNVLAKVLLTSGTFDGANAVINMANGDWTNNGGTFSPSTSIVNFNAASIDQYINGTATSQTFYDLTADKAGKTLSVDGSTATLQINNDLNIANGTFNQGVADNINIGGDWINDGTFTDGTASVNFIGSAAQAISGATTTTFYNLGLNNSAGGLTLNTPAIVERALSLTNGELITSAANMLTLTASAGSSSGTATSYVAGPMKKIGNTAFIFPVGKDGRWRRAGVSGMSNANTEITAEYFGTPYSDVTSVDTPGLDLVSDLEYWMIDRNVTSDPVKISLYWEDALASGIQNCDYLTLAHYTGGQWHNEAATTVGGSVCSGNGNGSIEMDGTVSNFSPFSFGSHGGGAALPVKLLRFEAQSKDNLVATTWTTSLEINNDYFTVERSNDGTDFKEVGRVEGSGNSTVERNYTFNDEHPLSGVSYYRLKQTDYDGQFAYSNIVMVKRSMAAASSIHLYPNPTADKLNIAVSNASEEMTIQIFNQVGASVYQQVISLGSASADKVIRLNVKDILAAGIYVVNLTTNQSTFKEKLIVK